jgi:hypothetical protein
MGSLMNSKKAPTMLVTVRSAFATALFFLSAGCVSDASQHAIEPADTISYFDYSAYPKWNRAWASTRIRVDLGKRVLSLNDVGDRYELSDVEGWQVLRSRLFVIAAPVSPTAASEIVVDGRRFKRRETRGLRLLGTQVDAAEILLEDKASGEELGYVYYSPDRGIVAISYSEAPAWLMYILAGECGLMAPQSCK